MVIITAKQHTLKNYTTRENVWARSNSSKWLMRGLLLFVSVYNGKAQSIFASVFAYSTNKLQLAFMHWDKCVPRSICMAMIVPAPAAVSESSVKSSFRHWGIQWVLIAHILICHYHIIIRYVWFSLHGLLEQINSVISKYVNSPNMDQYDQW